MVNISSLCPYREGCRFDYYLNTHMPMSIDLLSKAPGFCSVSVERAISIERPPVESAYVAMCHYYFDSIEAFLQAFAPHADVLQGDISNYTDIDPIIQINRVETRL